MQLQDVLYFQGFGTRRVCAGLIQQGFVSVASAVVTDAATEIVATGLHFEVQGVLWEYHEKAYVLLHKPAGTECSHKPSTWPSIYTLLPGPLRVGNSWREPGRGSTFERKVKTAGGPCKAAGFAFGDCLVVAVVQKQGKRVAKKFTETYAAGVGLVEDASWQLVDLKGL